ncbi:protein Gvp36p [[Candida] railenensis]|uniref:Protein Gvp36p n=1 Tax=[Candida] railenensis TaxID=45579 RepID=A0A9P0QLK7_9ASCO|nr:protein Gvp36p [[Candida] railenensis]
MSFKFPSFNFQSIQESLPSVDNITKSISNVNVQQYSDSLKDSIQPFASKTSQLISTQLHQVQQLAATHYNNSNVEVSELPADYLELEKNCDLLLKLYTDLIQITNDTYLKTSYDYPPGNNSLNRIRDANVGGLIGNKFTQLRNASSPQELEKILLGSQEQTDSAAAPAAEATTATEFPKTLFHQLALISSTHSKELNPSPLSIALDKLSVAYKAIGDSRLEQDEAIKTQLNSQLIHILNEEFIKVTELRKRVYASRSQFDLIRSEIDAETEDDNEELIAREDELVNATESAVTEMKKLLKPSRNINLLKVFVNAQKEFFQAAAKKLETISADLDKIEFEEEDDE